MKLVQQTLNQNKQSETIKSNQSKVQEALKAKFGDKAQEAVAAKAAELGVSPSELGDLASKSPAMVLALFQTRSEEHKSELQSLMRITYAVVCLQQKHNTQTRRIEP